MDAGSILILILIIIIAAAYLLIQEKKKRKELCKEIEMVLAGFVDSGRTKQEQPEQLKRNSEIVEISNNDLDRIYRQLIKLQSYMNMLKDKAALEQEEVKSIVTDISHQLKNPVAVMDMSLSLLEDESLSYAERKEFVGRLRGSMKELEILMDSLIQISRIESGLIEIKPKEKPLTDTIMTAVNCVFLKADEKHISIEMDDKENIGEVPIPHDSKWMAEAFINLFENAVKYSPAESSITIRLSPRNGFLRVEIEDEGIGIPKEERNKVLTRFYRGKSQWVQDETGSGVGLFLVNKIIRMHGGMVMIRTGRGQTKEFPGTIMVLQIPAENRQKSGLKDPEHIIRLTEL